MSVTKRPGVTRQMEEGMRYLLADAERLKEMALTHSVFSAELHEALMAVCMVINVAEHRQEGKHV